MAFVEHQVQDLLAELLVHVVDQGLFEEVELVGLEAVEVVLAESGVEEHVLEDGVVLLQVVPVDRPGENGHLLVHAQRDGGGHRVELLGDLLDGHRSGPAAGQHVPGELAEPLLSGGVVGRADLDQHAEAGRADCRRRAEAPR